ncbi:hypothetical protein ACHAXS_004081 [Conticribra weissflogii]
MNTLEDKNLVARMKVVDTHFVRKFDIDAFRVMTPSLIAEVLGLLSRSFADLENHGTLPFYDDFTNDVGENEEEFPETTTA